MAAMSRFVDQICHMCSYGSVVLCLYYSCVYASVPVSIYSVLKKSDDLYPSESPHVPVERPCPKVSQITRVDVEGQRLDFCPLSIKTSQFTLLSSSPIYSQPVRLTWHTTISICSSIFLEGKKRIPSHLSHSVALWYIDLFISQPVANTITSYRLSISSFSRSMHAWFYLSIFPSYLILYSKYISYIILSMHAKVRE